MSETETHIGKLTKVIRNCGAEETAKRLLSELNIEKEDYYDTYLECLNCESDMEYVVIKGDIYKISNHTMVDSDIYHASKNEDGTINFVVSYYNGGCSFDEAIEEAMDNIEGAE